MNQKLIQYFSQCFSHAIKQNKGDPGKVNTAIENIVPHAFGNHETCREWCQGRILGEKFKHNHLPHGKPLTDLVPKISLINLLSKYANKAEQISQCGSTQANESLNQVISTKNPKSKHYAASESLSYRIGAAVCQKNIRVGYASRVFNKLEYSPGKETEKFRRRKDELRLRKAAYSKTVEFKRRRNKLKKGRSSKAAAAKCKEGVTCESGVALNDVSESIPKALSNSQNSVSQDLGNNCKIVIFDLETTGLSQYDEICQVKYIFTIF